MEKKLMEDKRREGGNSSSNRINNIEVATSKDEKKGREGE